MVQMVQARDVPERVCVLGLGVEFGGGEGLTGCEV